MSTPQERRDEARLDNLETAYGTRPYDRDDDAETVARIMHEVDSGWPWDDLSDEEREPYVKAARRALDEVTRR